MQVKPNLLNESSNPYMRCIKVQENVHFLSELQQRSAEHASIRLFAENNVL